MSFAASTTLIVGRRKPYTAIGIRRVPCARCGEPSSQQWQVCANGNRWLGICWPCDVALNRLALEFMRVPNAEALMAAYAEGEAKAAQVEPESSRSEGGV